MEKPQRLMALSVTSVYRTVSKPAVFVKAGVPPIHFMARERSYTRRRQKEGTDLRITKAEGRASARHNSNDKIN